MAVLLAYLPDPCTAARLRRAMERAAHLRLLVAASWDELLRLALANPPDLAVVDPFAAPGLLERCVAFRAQHPAADLLPYGRLDGRPAHELFRLFELGVQTLVVRDVDDDPAALRRAVLSVLTRRLADRVDEAAGALFPSPLRPLLRHLVLHAGTPLAPDDVARGQHCHAKTLRARLRSAGLPSLNRLIVWTRLLAAAQRVAVTGRSVEQVALDMDFPSAAALRNQLQRYAGLAGQDLRSPGGVDRLLDRFRAAVAGVPRAAGEPMRPALVRGSAVPVRERVRAAA